MGSMSRKFLNLIVNEQNPGFKSLRCIDLTLQKFFYDAPAPPPSPPDGDGSAGGARDAAGGGVRDDGDALLCLPRPSYSFRAGDSDASDEWGMHCFLLGDRKVVCADQSGLAFAFDAETRVVGTMCGLRKPKRMPFSLPNFSYVQIRSLFVMERFPEPEAKKSDGKSRQFEAFFNDMSVLHCAGSGKWSQRLLPQPPFVVRKARKGGRSSTRPGPVEITAYTVVGRGSRSWVPDEWDGRGTYYFYFEDGSCIWRGSGPRSASGCCPSTARWSTCPSSNSGSASPRSPGAWLRLTSPAWTPCPRTRSHHS
jgi:hypothetical protein